MNRERIDRLVTLASTREDEFGREVAAAQLRVQSARELFDELESRYNDLRDQTHAGSEQSGEALTQTEAYADKLRSRMDEASATLARAEEQLRDARAALTEAGRERLATEQLAWRERQDANARAHTDEQREDDELSLRRRLTEEN